MTEFISSDTNIWIDFSNIDAVEIPFSLDFKYLMYEVTFQKEVLEPSWLPQRLLDFGIHIVDIDISEYELADEYGSKYRQLTQHDRIALAIAKCRGLTLMTGDGNLRKAAQKEKVNLLGTLGVLELAVEHGKIEKRKCVELLIKLRDCQKSRFPKDLIESRIKKYSED